MTDNEVRITRQRARALSDEEQAVFIQEFPIGLVIQELENRINDLVTFKETYRELGRRFGV